MLAPDYPGVTMPFEGIKEGAYAILRKGMEAWEKDATNFLSDFHKIQDELGIQDGRGLIYHPEYEPIAAMILKYKKMEGASDAIRQAFGLRTVFASPVFDETDIFAGRGRIYLDKRASAEGFGRITGHELLHTLVRKQSSIYKYFSEKAK